VEDWKQSHLELLMLNLALAFIKRVPKMAKVVKKSDDPGFFAKGGKTKMFGKGEVGKITAGQTGKDSNAPSGGGAKWAAGGSNHMFGKGSAGQKTPGVSGKESQVG
jgi:hypothetical protein